jgi:hypothetical protein
MVYTAGKNKKDTNANVKTNKKKKGKRKHSKLIIKNEITPNFELEPTPPGIKMQRQMNCNPANRNDTVQETSCYTEDVLNQIKDAYNQNNEKELQITSTDPKYIWWELRKRLDHCEQEDCWLREIQDKDVKKQIDNIIFAPDRPNEWNKDPVSWLSNYDIASVLRQYEVSHPTFKLLGPSSIDYDTKLGDGECVWNDLCKISLNNLVKSGKRKLGIVFNLDKHNQPGSHWVSLFVDLDNNVIFYYDSATNSIPREVTRLKNNIIAQGKDMIPRINFRYIHNDHQHQTTNTECGMYCLFFIISWLTMSVDKRIVNKSISRLTGGKNKRLISDDLIRLFTKPGITDKMMIECRKLYFNKK